MCGCCSVSTATHRQLADTSSVRTDGGLALRCHSRPYVRAVAKTKIKEKCAFSSTEDHLSRCSVGFDRDVDTSVSCSDQFDPLSSQESKRRPVTHCQTVSETDGYDGSCVQHDTFRPAVHNSPAVVTQDQRVFPKGQPASQDQGHTAMLTYLRHVEETLDPVTRPRAGAHCFCVMLMTDTPLTGWGVTLRRVCGKIPISGGT